MNLRVSGTITVGNTGSAVRAEYLVCPNAGGMSDINEHKFDDNIELTASAKVDGDIDLGAGINTAVINSNASLKGVIKSGAGEVNITFELEEIPSNNRSTVVVEKFSEDDKTLKDSKTITINLNYAREGKYDLIEYKFDVSEYWVEKERNIAFKFQGNTYNVTMKTDPQNSNAVCGSFTDINGVEVIARFERNIFSVEVKGELPAAREVKTTDFINEFAEEISMVKNDKLTLKWDMLDAWLKEKIDAGSLKLVDGQKLSEFTSYQVVYVLRDNEGNQIGGPRTVSVTGSSYNVNLLEAAIENNVAVKTIGSAKLISISVIGNTENGIQQGMTYDFSPLITEEVEETCSLTLEWSDEHDEFTDLLDKGKLYADNGATIRKNDPYHYEISVQAYSRTGKKLGNPVKFVIDGDKDSYAVSLQEMGEALDIKYTDIAAISLESVALVSDGKKATRQSDNKASRLEVELSWNELHDEWMEQIANGSLKNESGHDIKNFKNYELTIKLFDKEGTYLGSVNRVVADGAISYTANLSDLVSDISGDYLWSDIFSLQIEKVTLFDENDLSVESTGSFDEIQMVDLAGAGVLFNWDSLHYNLENKCKAGKLDDTAGNRVESLGNYTVSYILRDKNGNQIGSDVYTREDIEGSNVKIYYAGHAGVKAEDIAEIEILSITCASTDINGNAGNVAHEFSQSATLVTYDAIKVKWTERKDEFTTLLDNNQLFDENNKKIEEINGYVITVEAYDVSGEKLGNGKLYQYTVSGNIDECDLKLQKIADALDIPYVQDIAKVKVVGVTVVGEELNVGESANKLVQASEFTESNRIINLDWSDLNAEILAEGSINEITLATEDGIRAYELTVIFQDANGNQVGSPIILDDELIETLAPGATGVPYKTSYSIDVNAIAPELNIDPSTVYSARIQKFVVHVNDANGNKREVVIDCLTPARETKQNIAKTVLEWTELHAMLQNEMTPETYEITFVMKDESGNVLATANPLTFTVNSSEYTVYLKDYEYLLDGENTINDVAKLEIVKINVSGTDAGGNAVNRSFSGVEFVADTEFDDPEMTLDWYSIADDCKAQIAAGTLVGLNGEVVTGIKSYEITYVLRDKDGKQLGEIVEVTGLTYADYEVNLAEAANSLGIEFTEIAEVELAKVVLVGTTETDSEATVEVYSKKEQLGVTEPFEWSVPTQDENGNEITSIGSYAVEGVLRKADGTFICNFSAETTAAEYEVDIDEAIANAGVTGVTAADVASAEITRITAQNINGVTGADLTLFELIERTEEDDKDSNRNLEMTLEWKTLHDSLVSKLNNGTLEDAEGNKLTGFSEYRIAYIFKDKSGKQLGDVFYVTSDRSSFEVSFADGSTTADGIDYDKVGSVELIEVIWVGNDENGVEREVFHCNVDVTKTAPREDVFVVSWSEWANSYEIKTLIKDYYTITMDVINANGKVIGTFTRDIRADFTSYEVDVERVAEQLGVSSDAIKRIDLTKVEAKEYGSSNILAVYSGLQEVVLVEYGKFCSLEWNEQHNDWMKEIAAEELRDSAGNVIASFTDYTITIALKDAKGNVLKKLDIADITGSTYNLDIEKIAGDNNIAFDNIAAVELVSVTLNGGHGVTEQYGKEFDLVTNGIPLMTLDWKTIDQNLRSQLDAQVLIDENGTLFAEFTSYRISYELRDAEGNRIGNVLSAETTAPSYSVNLEGVIPEGCNVDDVASVRLTAITFCGKDAAGNDLEKDYSWTQAVSMLETFVENYKAEDKALTISWYGVDPAEYGLLEIAAFEVEYILYDQNGYKMGESIAFKVDGSKNSITINGVDENTSVAWRFRVLGDDSGTTASAWSDYRTAHDVIQVSSPSKFYTENFSSSVIDANPQEDTTGVVAAIANLFWDEVQSDKAIRKYVIEYCELPDQITLDDVPVGMSLEDYIASNGTDGLFVNSAMPVYVKEVTGTEVAISDFQNQAYVYWRIKAVDVDDASSEWLAGQTFRVWTNNDTSAPVFPDVSTGLLAVTFPGVEYVEPAKDYDRKQEEGKESTYSVMVGWNRAEDSESGVRAYLVEFSTDGGKTFTQYESVDSEDVVSYSYGSWYDESLDPDTTYRIVYRNAAGRECVLEADSMVKIPGNTSATANTDLVFVDVTLKEENGKLTLSWCAPSKTMDFIGQDITIEYKVGDTWLELVRNVDDFKYSTYDYTCTVDGLTGKDYQYRVVAVDYFGNKVPVSRVVSGSINSDVSDPNFVFSTTENPNPYADRTFAQYGYKEDEDNLEAEVLLSGELYWSLATDSESAVRKYIIKFSADGGKTFDDKLTQELAVADLEKSFSQLHLDNIGLTITAGKYYTVTVDGNDIIVKAEKDGVLTLDRFIEDLSGKTIVVSGDSSVSVKLNDSMVSTFEYKITEFKHEKLVAGKTYDIVLDNGDVVSATATLNNNKEAVLIVERDIFEKRITIIEHNTEIFNGMTSRENTTLFYKVDIASMNMPASGYTYEIFAYDYFGQTGKPLVGKIEADQTPPVFEKNETQVSGFVYEKPDWEPTVAGNLAETASYSTYIGWHQAVDKDDKGVPASGLRCYELRISTDGGKTWEVSATIDPDELVTRTFCSWVPAPGEEALDVECAYRVCLLDEEGKTTDTYSSAVVGRKDGSNELNLTWVADGNMKGRTFVIQKRDGASWANVSDIGTVKMSDDRDCVVYECSWEIRGMTAEEFSYQIVAKDLCGYTSYIQKDVEVDKGTPMFAKNSIRVEVGEPVKDSENNNEITLTPTFYWNPAQDQAGDVGVRYYVVRYRLKAEDGEPAGEWIVGGTIEHVAGTTEYMWASTNKLEWDVYEYEVIAYDFFGNKTTAKGTFGTPDTEGPKVFFDDEAYANIVEYEYKDATEMVARRDSEGNLVYDSNGKIIYDEVVVMVQQPVLDSNGNIVYDINGDPLMQEVPARGDLAEAKVTLKWDGTFVDDSDGDILFKVTISDSMEFSPEGNTYDFWTTDTSLVFDNDTPGRNVGLFENMKQVYWRVQVYDQYYNEGDKIGARQEFYFVNDEDQQLSVSAGLTKPENIEVTYTWLTTDDQRSNTARIKWTHDEQPLGVYYYEIKLVSKSDPKFTYTASTVAKDVQNAGTDLSELVSYNKSSNTFELSDLMQLLRETDSKYTDIADGEYNLVITAYDSNGRKAASSSVNFVMDDTRPERVDRNRIEAFVVSDNLNHDKYSQPVVRWAESIDRTAGIERYELSYRIKGSNSTFETVKIDADTREFIFPSVPEGTTYEYYIIAIDKSGNRSFDWGTGVYEEITARNDDFYRDSLTAVESEPAIGWTGNRIEVKDSVGMGDPADMFKIETGKSTAITLTVDELANLLGTNDDITIEIYKIVDGNYAKAKVFKRYSVSNTGQVFSDLLLDANSTYAFKVVSKSTKNSVVDYSLVIDKKDLGGSATGNDNSDDTYERAIANHKSFVINSELHDLSSFNDWVGYGDSSDWRALSINNSGKFNFSISDAAMDVTLTVYELQENGKMKKLGSVKAGAKELDGKVLQNVVMDREGDYYLEVKANNTKSYGSDYTVTVECVESYPAATEYDDLSAVLTAPANVPKLAINSKLSAAANGEDLWVGIGDTVDYYLIDGSVYRDKEYSLKLDGTNGKEVKVAIGYFNNGKFVTIKSQTGTAGSEAVNILCSFTYDQLSKSQGKLYVQVSSNGTNANSRYTVEFKEYSNMAGADSSDDDAAVTEKYLYNGTPVDDWVGYVDAVDYREISIAENGVYEIKLDGADNNLTITVVQQVVNAKTGKISYRTVKSVKATAANNSVTTGALLLDTNEKYFVSVNATSAKKGGDSDYTLSMEKLGSTVQLEGKTVFSMNDDIQDVSSAVNYVYDAADLGGAYKFTLNNTEATGNVKLTVYELLTTGSKRTVKTLTVKAGDEGNTGYLYFDDSAAKNGTGIYQVEVQGVKSTVSGAVSISGTGYSFDKYLAKAEDVNNSFADINWVGTGDETDSYDYTVAEGHEGIHEFKLTGFDGNSIKLKIVDANGKVLKTFTTAKNTSEATFAYDFKNVGAYTLVVEANGKGRFSEYTLSYVDRSADANGFDNSSAILGDPDSWNIDDTTKLTAANDVSGWVGLGDAEDFYGIVVDADGNYDLNIGNIENYVKVTLYQATKYNTNDDTIKSGKAIKSVTASAENGGAVLSGVYLNANEHYYVVVKAGNSKGTGNTTYTLNLDKMATAETTQSGKVGSANTAETYCFTAVAGATAISLSLGENSKSESAVVTLYEVNKVTGKYTKVKSLTANSKNLTVNTGDLCLNYDSTYVVEVTAPKVKDGKEVDFTLNVKSWNFADFDGDSDNDVMKKDKATAITLKSASELNAVWANGDAVDYYYVNADADGSYSINLNGINGNTIKVSIISVGADGKTKVLQSVTGKAGADSLILSRDLAAGQYYVKVESVGKNTASQYVLTMTQNNTDNTDDAWKQVAGKVDVTSYDTGDVITDWVGFGDATDVFKVVLDENGSADNHQIAFAASNEETLFALQNNIIEMTLVDNNGKKVALTFDKENGCYISKNLLMAGVDYYLQVKNKSPKTSNVDYGINVVEYSMFSNADDTWQQVAGDIDSVSYGAGDAITDWVGFGDAVDVFKIRLEDIAGGADNGQVVFSGVGDTIDALIGNDIELSLVDANGNSISLTFDSEKGNYTSTDTLMAGVDYYLTVKNSNEKKQNIDYNIDINLA
ncbi:MAG: fibronectin type III domain-containing protein [Lentisphaeria bacterium]|nr:fibronectin type III domain-containing protein [Lentisphaeria bacterium]